MAVIALAARPPPAPVRVTIVNGSPEDVRVDFEDASTIDRSGAFRFVNNHNHPGMKPSGAVVLGANLPYDVHGHYLLRSMGEVARKKSLPLLAGLDVDPCGPNMWPASWKPLGRHVTVGSTPFLLRPAHPFEAAPLLGSPSYLLAARMAIAFSQRWGGGGLSGSLSNVRLARPSSRSRAVFAATRGFVELVQRGPDAALVEGVTASPSATGSRSLDLHVIACRLALQLQNLHFRRLWSHSDTSEADIRDPVHVASLLETGLRERLAHHGDFAVSLVDAHFEDPPSPDGTSFLGALSVDLAVDLPSADHDGFVRHTERATVRLGF